MSINKSVRRHMVRAGVAVATLVAVTGCAGVKPRADFPAVAADVAARTGYAVRWHDGSAADREAEDRVDALLARPLTADAAVQIALLNSRRLQATYENLGVAQADLVAAGLLRNPVFDAAYRFGEAGASARIDFGLTFDFVDLLFLGVRKDLAAAEVESAKARVTAAVLDLAGAVKTAFYVQQAATQAVDLRRQVADATAASADFAKRLRDAGNTTALALANEQALHAEATLALGRAETDAATARERLSGLLGLWGGQTAWTVAGRLAEPADDKPLAAAAAERRAVAASLDLRIATADVAAARRSLGIVQPLGVLSELETGVSAEREGGEWFTGPTVTLPLPIFSQGQPAAVKAAARVRQAEANRYAAAIELRSAVRVAVARVTATRTQVDATRLTLLPLRQAVVEQTQLQYNAMQVGAFQLLSAKRDQIEAAAAYLTLLRDYWIAKSDLDLLLNGGRPRGAMPDLRSNRFSGETQMNTDEHG